MSIARHHAEWLSLVPVSGPFLSMPVLMQAFPQGLDAHDSEHARLLRLAYEEWDDSFQKKKVDPSVHDSWIKFVLTKTLEFDESLLAEGQAIPQTLHVQVPEHGELLRPSIVLNDPSTQKARMLIRTYPRSQDLTSYVAGSRWKASPETRMTDLLHGTGVRLGLVTNGEHWMLVDAPKGETTGYASWYASLWREEKITLQAFRSLFSIHRFFGVSDNETIEALLAKSASNQQEVTEQLGSQVLRAVEVLIQSLDKADQDHGRELLGGVTEPFLYESALTVMMRLVFLFCAEERELIPTKPFPVYEQNYSVSTMSKQLREIADQHGEELLERRFDGWPRLLSAFRAVYSGLAHDDVYMPAYGGRLFDPDRFPFLEGREKKTSWQDTEATPLPVNNRTVLHLLEALQLLQVKVPGGGPAEARRVSFRALDIEQIGHVYEGLLDHTAKRASEPTLGLIGKKEPEVALQKLEQEREKGNKQFFDFLKKQCGSSRKWENYLDVGLDDRQERRLRTACGNDESLFERVKPFAALLRDDSFGYPVVVPESSVFVTAGTDRRSSGTHYTPRSLTEPIVQHTLEPLIYVGPAEGKPKSEWKLKSAADLLDLKICDMACGSGAFLVQAARYMSERLMEAWDAAKEKYPDVPGITPEGKPSAGGANESLIPDDPAERTTYAMRIIAQRCLYGVDVNPLATEMAKLSLWLLTLAKDKPFEFLDHAIRCGDSLVGLHDLEQLRHFSLKPDNDDTPLFKGPLDNAVEEAVNLRLKLEDMPSNTVEDIEAQEELLKDAEGRIARLRSAADLLVSAEFWGEGPKDKQEKVRHAAVVAGHYVENGPSEEFEGKAQRERRGQKMFHWPLEFPEVVVKRGGFDGIVGNPPFIKGSFISGHFGDTYRGFIQTHVADDKKGNADFSAFFLLRAGRVISTSGLLGLILTNSIAEGDTREVGLDQLLARGATIVRTVPSLKWPGVAALQVACLWCFASTWGGRRFIGGRSATSITAYLAEGDAASATPFPLVENARLSYTGNKIYGDGFVLTPEEAQALIDQRPSNSEVIFPYVKSDDLLNNPSQTYGSWVINFGEMSLEGARRYPECISIVERLVKPYRDSVKVRKTRENWWLHERRRPELYAAIKVVNRVLFHGFTCKYLAFTFVPTEVVFAAPHVVILLDQWHDFSILQSSLHEAWVRKFGSTLETRMRYPASDVFETFPRPVRTHRLGQIGEKYYGHRGAAMVGRSVGLTQLYNRFHDPDESPADIQKLRGLHIEMDQAVAAAYGWDDLDLGHGFHETKQGLRFTISESARREILQRLLKLNHERYEEEVAQGLHKKTKGKGKKVNTSRKTASPKKRRRSQPVGPTLFGDDDDEGG
ncbi:MAG: type IIL restriction-modification enzyme MmeI [Candidatus Paceibacterota bacterium]